MVKAVEEEGAGKERNGRRIDQARAKRTRGCYRRGRTANSIASSGWTGPKEGELWVVGEWAIGNGGDEGAAPIWLSTALRVGGRHCAKRHWS